MYGKFHQNEKSRNFHVQVSASLELKRQKPNKNIHIF
jgi:hypothetical protein